MKVLLFAALLVLIAIVSAKKSVIGHLIRINNEMTPFSEGSSDALITLKISGNYCGPGFCGGKIGDYTKNGCDFSAPAKDCGDQCCKVHDDCCIRNRGKCGHCDDAISNCLRACKTGNWLKKAEWWAIATFFDHRGNSCC